MYLPARTSFLQLDHIPRVREPETLKSLNGRLAPHEPDSENKNDVNDGSGNAYAKVLDPIQLTFVRFVRTEFGSER